MQSSCVISDGLKSIYTRQNILMPLDKVIVYSQFKRSAAISIFQGETMLASRGGKNILLITLHRHFLFSPYSSIST